MAKYVTTIEIDGVKILTSFYDDKDNVEATDQERMWKRYNIADDAVWTKALLEAQRIAFVIAMKRIKNANGNGNKFWLGTDVS